MYYTPILFDIMALYQKRSQCSRSSQGSGTALLVSRGSGGEGGGRPPENTARPTVGAATQSLGCRPEQQQSLCSIRAQRACACAHVHDALHCWGSGRPPGVARA